MAGEALAELGETGLGGEAEGGAAEAEQEAEQAAARGVIEPGGELDRVGHHGDVGDWGAAQQVGGVLAGGGGAEGGDVVGAGCAVHLDGAERQVNQGRG